MMGLLYVAHPYGLPTGARRGGERVCLAGGRGYCGGLDLNGAGCTAVEIQWKDKTSAPQSQAFRCACVFLKAMLEAWRNLRRLTQPGKERERSWILLLRGVGHSSLLKRAVLAKLSFAL